MKTALTRISHNRKTGLIPVSNTSAFSCPDACPFKNNGCYASGGPLNIHWQKITRGERGVDYNEFCDQVSSLPKGQLWRHNTSGDLRGKNNWINFKDLKQLVKANNLKKGFTYTHKPVLVEDIKDNHLTTHEKWVIVQNNREAIKFANENGFTVNLSGNNLDHADKLKALKIGPVVSVVPIDQKTAITKQGNKAVVCPATTEGSSASCSTCQLCQKGSRQAVVAFPAHGVSKKKVAEITKSY